MGLNASDPGEGGGGVNDQPQLYALKKPDGMICWWSLEVESAVDVTQHELDKGYTVVPIKPLEEMK